MSKGDGSGARQLRRWPSGVVAASDIPIPKWYRSGMTTQIAVRLPDELVEMVDRWVRSGRARSRADVVARALEREARRELAERDAAILAASGPDRDLDGLARYAASVPMDDLD